MQGESLWFDRSCDPYTDLIDRQQQQWQLFAPECIVCGRFKATTLAPTPSTTTTSFAAPITTTIAATTTTTRSNSNDSLVSEEQSSSDDGALIGGVVAGVLLVLICCIIVALALFSIYGRKKTTKKVETEEVAAASVVQVTSIGNYGSVGAAQNHYSQMTMADPTMASASPETRELPIEPVEGGGQYGAAPKFKTASELGTTATPLQDEHYGVPPQKNVGHYDDHISPLQV